MMASFEFPSGGRGWGRGKHDNVFTPTSVLPHQGAGKKGCPAALPQGKQNGNKMIESIFHLCHHIILGQYLNSSASIVLLKSFSILFTLSWGFITTDYEKYNGCKKGYFDH
jgi:hypothetical protein